MYAHQYTNISINSFDDRVGYVCVCYAIITHLRHNLNRISWEIKEITSPLSISLRVNHQSNISVFSHMIQVYLLLFSLVDFDHGVETGIAQDSYHRQIWPRGSEYGNPHGGCHISTPSIDYVDPSLNVIDLMQTAVCIVINQIQIGWVLFISVHRNGFLQGVLFQIMVISTLFELLHHTIIGCIQ